VDEPDPALGRPVGSAASSAGEIAISGREDGTAVMRISGALDLALAPKLRQLAERAVRMRPRVLVIDLTEVGFLASVGMAELLRVHRQLRGVTPVRFVAADRLVLRPLTLTRLIDEFDMFPTLAEAVAGR
jgi:anti-sigma B factor antagonist